MLLLHGILRRAGSMAELERALRSAGHAVLNLDYPSRRKPLDALADDVAAAVEPFLRDGGEPLHVVAYSLGGLLSRAWLTRHRPPALGRVVMLGTPNGGSEIADLFHRHALSRRAFDWVYGPAGAQLVTRHDDRLRALLGPVDYALGVIAGNRALDPVAARLVLPRPNDGRVSVASTRVDGMADHLVLPVSHALMMRDPGVIRQTLHFLRHGRFERDAA